MSLDPVNGLTACAVLAPVAFATSAAVAALFAYSDYFDPPRVRRRRRLLIRRRRPRGVAWNGDRTVLLTVVDARPLALAVVLPALGSWWDFSRRCWAHGPPVATMLLAMKPMPLAAAPFDAVRWAVLPDECSLPDAAPLIVLVDAKGLPLEVLDWSGLTFTVEASTPRTPVR